jgi:hypothetical protein
MDVQTSDADGDCADARPPTNLDGACMDSPDSCATPEAGDEEFPGFPPAPVLPPAAEVPTAFVPSSLTIAGLQHITNNLCTDVHEHLKHWGAFWIELKNFESLLAVAERRKRFVWTWLRGSHLQHRERMFNKFIGSLYEARWRAVLDLLKHILPLLRVLAATWDADKFVRGVDAVGASRPARARAQQASDESRGLNKFEPKWITKSLKDGLFYLMPTCV